MNTKSGFKILFFNPRSARAKYRIPMSIMTIAATIDDKYDWVIVDGNRESDPYKKIRNYLKTGGFKYVGFTVMPGPQLKEGIPFTINIKKEFPGIIMIWGGYFASNQYKTVIDSPYVDFVIHGPGDHAFPLLIEALEHNTSYENIENLVYKKDDKIVKNQTEKLPDQDSLPDIPYKKLDKFYSVNKYLGKTHLGKKTFAYNSSLGCPFKCSFCGVVPIYEARWKGKSATRIYKDIIYAKDNWGIDAVEFYDNNFSFRKKESLNFAVLSKMKR